MDARAARVALTPLIIFAKPIVQGRVKTRLAKGVGEPKATELYAAFVRDTFECVVNTTRYSPQLWCADEPDERLAEWAEHHGIPIFRQSAGDLGARIQHALDLAISEAGAGVVIGTDSPTLPLGYIELAERRLNGSKEPSDLVIGPTCDGGYYLIGARGEAPALDGVRWSTPNALSDTKKRNRASQLALLPPWYDVDTHEDLRLMRTHLSLDAQRAPHTARLLFP